MLQSFISGLCRAKTKSLLKQRPSSENHDTSTANHAQTHTVRDSKQRQIKPTEQIKKIKNQTPRLQNKTNQKLPKRCVQRNGHTCGICLTAREGEKKIREVMSIERLELENRVVRLLCFFLGEPAGLVLPPRSAANQRAKREWTTSAVQGEGESEEKSRRGRLPRHGGEEKVVLSRRTRRR